LSINFCCLLVVDSRAVHVPTYVTNSISSLGLDVPTYVTNSISTLGLEVLLGSRVESHNSGMPDDSDNISSGGEENLENSDDGSIDSNVMAHNANVADIALAQRLVTGNPLKKFERRSTGKLKGAEDPAVVEEYLRRLFTLPSCFSKYNNKFMSCTCLHDQQENVDYAILADRLSKHHFCFCSVIFYILFLSAYDFVYVFLQVKHAGQPSSIRQTFLKERILAAQDYCRHRNSIRNRAVRRDHNRYKVYRFSLHHDAERLSMICQVSFRNLLGLFKYQWQTIKSSALSAVPGPIMHGNTGKRNRFDGSTKKTVEEDVIAFLSTVGEERGESYATRFVRDRTSVGLRKDEEDLIELPSCLTKRRLYKQFCFERGHIVSSTDKGSYGSVDQFLPRPFDEDLWPENSPVLPAVSWAIFHNIWKTKLQKLRIRNSCEDTCPECYVLKNKFKFRAEARHRPSSDEEDDDSNSSSSSSSVNSDEELIIKANEHIEQAIAQRTYINTLKLQAESEADNEHSARR
jgi:hypothetical protein